MSTLTLVLTRKSSSETVQIRLDARPKNAISVAINQLAVIFSDHLRENDHLSRRLLLWSSQVITAFSESELVNEEEVAKQIHQLAREILISPIDQAPFSEPVLVNGAVWERRMWEDYQRVFNLPPQEIRVHEFALDMIAWLESLPVKIEVLKGRVSFDYSEPVENKVLLYEVLLQNAEMIQSLQGLQERMQRDAETCRRLWEEAKEKIAHETAEMERNARQHTEFVRQSILNIETSYRREVAQQAQQIVSLQTELRNNAARIAAIQNQAALHVGEINDLRARLVQLSHQNAVNSRAVHRKRRGCVIS